MENKLANSGEDGQGEEDSFNSLSKDIELSGDDSLDCSELKDKILVRRVNSRRTLILNVKQSLTSKSILKNLFFQSNHGLDTKIARHMVTLDERYLRRCLEFIHISASKAAQCNISVNFDSAKMGILWDYMNPVKIGSENACDLANFVFECPLEAESGNVVISPGGQCILGSIMGSKSMINILKSPLLSKFGASDGDGNFQRITLNDDKGPIGHDFMSFHGEFSGYSSQNLEKERRMLENHKQGSEARPNRLVSVSSTNSSCSDQSSSSTSASASVSLGMLQCMWKGGKPHFVFSVDERREVYIANLSKIESGRDKSLDYIYSFYWRKGGQKEHEVHGNEYLVGRMKVSTSITLCLNNSKIMETQFTLFGISENLAGEMRMSSHDIRKNKSLSKKVVEVFKTSQSWKQNTFSKYVGLNSILENSSCNTLQNLTNNFDALDGSSLSVNDLPPNLELAAIVVKDHLSANRPKEVGGWGLNFLKKGGAKQNVETLKTSAPSACRARDTGDCSTSMDILIPAGYHGGPRTRNGGPSGLIERWTSGGCCDCGGWDLGCPLTVLSTSLSKKEVLPEADMHDECKSFDLFIQGSEHGASALKMVNIRDGLYFIHFQSTLSALQSLSIAVASIHSQSPALRPKNVHELN